MLDPATFSYPKWVSPDVAGATQRRLTVTFQTRATPPVVLGTGNILFATNNQINVMVPPGISTQVGNPIDMIVSFGYGTGATMLNSAPQGLSVVAANPGLFTVAANGRGDGAILNTSYALVGSSNQAAMRDTASNSDTVQIFMTGLGVPNSAADNASAGTSSGAVWSTDCISLSSYLTSLNTMTGGSLTSAEGLVLSSSLINTNRLLPCFNSGSSVQPSVTVGGVAGTVTYAGLVADSFVGLYQVNVRLPGSGAGPFTLVDGTTVSDLSTPVQLPVVVTSGGRSSQPGVTMWVRRRLQVTPPSGAGLTGTVGTAWSSSNNSVTASQGTSPYRYAVTSGLLPAGLTLNATTGAITGTPSANTSGSYLLTVTATDSANVPLTGTVSFTLTIAGGLVVSTTGTAPFTGVFGTADASVTTASATGGTFPYTFSLTAPSPLPSGMTVGSSNGVLAISNSLPAGRYTTTIRATDAANVIGSVTFDVVVSLLVSNTTPVAATAGAASNVTTVSATGGTGAITYALDSATQALGWVTINANTGVVAVTTGAVAGTRSVTVTATAANAATGAAQAGTGTVTFNLVVN